jgi:S1-C subfamily serine protease
MTEAVEKVSDSVVSVNSTKFARTFRLGVVPIEGMGSGVIVDSRGYVITNEHVIDDADKVQVDLKDGRSFSGEVVGQDDATDIALVKIGTSDLPVATLGDSDNLKVGQIAIAIGNALSLPGGPTVSSGVISALGRSLPGADLIFEGFIQTDAAINPGNSGGPLADLNGNVIGINMAMMPYAQGVGFAIPINSVKRVVQQIIQHGRVVRPWLGISGTSVTSALARRYNLSTDSGVLIVDVARYSPAYDAGMRVGDVLRKIGQYQINELPDVFSALSKLSIGEVVPVSLIRMGVEGKTSLRLVETPMEIVRRRGR